MEITVNDTGELIADPLEFSEKKTPIPFSPFPHSPPRVMSYMDNLYARFSSSECQAPKNVFKIELDSGLNYRQTQRI